VRSFVITFSTNFTSHYSLKKKKGITDFNSNISCDRTSITTNLLESAENCQKFTGERRSTHLKAPNLPAKIGRRNRLQGENSRLGIQIQNVLEVLSVRTRLEQRGRYSPSWASGAGVPASPTGSWFTVVWGISEEFTSSLRRRNEPSGNILKALKPKR